MKDAMSKKLGTSTFYEMESDEGLLQSLFSKAESLVPKSEAQVLTETAKSVEKRGADVLCRTVTIIRRS